MEFCIHEHFLYKYNDVETYGLLPGLVLFPETSSLDLIKIQNKMTHISNINTTETARIVFVPEVSNCSGKHGTDESLNRGVAVSFTVKLFDVYAGLYSWEDCSYWQPWPREGLQHYGHTIAVGGHILTAVSDWYLVHSLTPAFILCLPWGCPYVNHAKRCMNEKTIQCLPNPLQHVPIYLQQFPSYLNCKCKKVAVFTYRSSHFCFPWRRPCDYHAIRCMVERQFNAYQTSRSMYLPIFNSFQVIRCLITA